MTERGTITLSPDGSYRMENTEPFTGKRGQRVFITAVVAPEFTLENYNNLLFEAGQGEGMGEAFIATR